MESLIVLLFIIIAIAGVLSGHIGVGLLSLLCTVFTRWAFQAILNAEPANCYDVLDEIKPHGTDLDLKD